MHVARTDTLPRPTQPHERAPLVGDLTADDGDQADLEDAVAPGRESRRLDVDDREAGECDRCVRHTEHDTQGVSQPVPYSNSAARLATSLRSHDVSVTWPKQRWPAKALVSTARALFDSLR